MFFKKSKTKDDGKGVLVDLTKCIGCGSCVVACKMYNKNEWIEDRAPTSGENATLADENWTVVQQCRISKETDKNVHVAGMSPPIKTDGSEDWRYVKRQCLHCKEPACVSSCFATAFKTNESGAITYYPNLCVGCRYCMLACPFSVPKFEWSKALPTLTKCTMCHNRIATGDAPACVTVCPTSVMKFGEHKELLKEAKAILSRETQTLEDEFNYSKAEIETILSRKYVDYIYGEEEAGGTAWIYISDKPFKELGFKMNVPKRSIPAYTENYMKVTPYFGLFWFVVLSCLYFITKRRSAKKEEKSAESA
jgi:formate dehydrogenase iron-sulfur subunit